MKKQLVNRILIIYILFNNTIMLSGDNKPQKQHKNKTKHSKNNISRPMGMVGQQQQLPMNPIQAQQMVGQNPLMTNPTMLTNTTINRIPTNSLPTNNSVPIYTAPANNLMNVTSTQMSNNNMSMTIVEQLDPMKAAQLVADIQTLKQNYKTLSIMLQSSIKIHFSENQNTQPISQKYTFNIAGAIIDPTKQIISSTGNYSNAPTPTLPAINPYTGALVTLLDLPTLTEIRRLYINNIHTLLFALSDIDANQWNVKQMQNYMGRQFQSLSTPAGQPRAYNFNALRPLWKQATDYIQQGRLNKKHIGIRSHLKPQQDLYNLSQQTNYGEQIQQQANTPQTNSTHYIGSQATSRNYNSPILSIPNLQNYPQQYNR